MFYATKKTRHLGVHLRASKNKSNALFSLDYYVLHFSVPLYFIETEKDTKRIKTVLCIPRLFNITF